MVVEAPVLDVRQKAPAAKRNYLARVFRPGRAVVKLHKLTDEEEEVCYSIEMILTLIVCIGIVSELLIK